MKIVSTGATLSSPEFYKKKKKARQTKLIVAGVGLLVVLGAFVFVSRMERFRISAVSVSGAQVISSDDVERVAKETLSGYYLYLVPRDSSFLYSRQALERELGASFPRFSNLGVSLASLQELEVTVSERKPYALYCGAEISPQDASVCYFLDTEGFIFDFAPTFSEGVYFVYASAQALENPRGSQFLPASVFKSLTDFVEGLKALGFEPRALKSGESQFEIFLPSEARILLARESDLALIYSDLESFLADEAIKTQENFLERVAELDLRTANKVFYKFK